jgi:hypothetical protein
MYTKLSLLALSIFFLFSGTSNATGNSACLSQCFLNHTLSWPENCCNCCPANQQCFGNAIAPVCCKKQEELFCGCLSSRAFCEGKIFNSTESVAPFGTCYTPTQQKSTCCYFPSPNSWMICPAETTCCGGVTDSITCCKANEECSPDQTGAAKCVPKIPSFICGNQVYNPSTHHCINGVLCGISDGVCKGNVCYNPRDATCYPHECAGTLQGSDSNDVLCGSGLVPCGAICINPTNYFCKNGTIQQKQAGGIQCGNSHCTGNQQCCSSSQPTFPFNQCYNPAIESCVTDPRGFNGLSTRICPLSHTGKAQGACLLLPGTQLDCFDIDTKFCCQGSSPGGTGASIMDLSQKSMCGRNNGCLKG